MRVVALAGALAAGGCGGSSIKSQTTASTSASGRSTTTTAKKLKPLTVDPCATLTEAEVRAFSDAHSGRYKAKPPFRTQPVPSYFIGSQGSTTTVDPATDRYCTWVFDQATPTGDTSDNATVEVHIRRMKPPDTSPRPPGFPAPQPDCTLFASAGVRDLSGIGDRAQSVGTIGAVVVGDVCSEVSYGGASEDTPDATLDASVAAVLRRLVVTVGSG